MKKNKKPNYFVDQFKWFKTNEDKIEAAKEKLVYQNIKFKIINMICLNFQQKPNKNETKLKHILLLLLSLLFMVCIYQIKLYNNKNAWLSMAAAFCFIFQMVSCSCRYLKIPVSIKRNTEQTDFFHHWI